MPIVTMPQFTAGREYFLYFGPIVAREGLGHAYSLAIAATERRLMVAGTGPELEKLRMLAAKLKADVTFLGYLAGEKMHEAARRARAVVLPSEWRENAPVSVLEGYALGKPVIGARIGGIPELILENETGVSFVSSKEKLRFVAALRDMAGAVQTPRLKTWGKVHVLGWKRRNSRHSYTRSEFSRRIRELGVDASSPRHRRAPAMD